MERNDGDALQSSWPQSSRQVKSKWSKLTDNDVRSLDGQSAYLVSRLQERYGWSRERAEHECQAFLDELEHSPRSSTPRSGTSNGEARSHAESSC